VQYVCLIYADETIDDSRSDEETNAILGEYFAFTDSIRKSGNYVGGEALQSTPTATTVRVRDDETLVTDGPFAETKEQLGGFYLIEAKDIDEATSIAARIPSARYGSIEVRPVMVFDQEPA
jgi:hypothetical protein